MVVVRSVVLGASVVLCVVVDRFRSPVKVAEMDRACGSEGEGGGGQLMTGGALEV